jgi:hypothetical protein
MPKEVSAHNTRSPVYGIPKSAQHPEAFFNIGVLKKNLPLLDTKTKNINSTARKPSVQF